MWNISHNMETLSGDALCPSPRRPRRTYFVQPRSLQPGIGGGHDPVPRSCAGCCGLLQKCWTTGSADRLFNGRLALYTSDFIIRMADNLYILCETRGRTDRDVPLKARAAVSWCKAATRKKVKRQYLYVPQGIFETMNDNRIETLMRTCEPTLNDLLRETVDRQLTLPFGEAGSGESSIGDFILLNEYRVEGCCLTPFHVI